MFKKLLTLSLLSSKNLTLKLQFSKVVPLALQLMIMMTSKDPSSNSKIK